MENRWKISCLGSLKWLWRMFRTVSELIFNKQTPWLKACTRTLAAPLSLSLSLSLSSLCLSLSLSLFLSLSIFLYLSLSHSFSLLFPSNYLPIVLRLCRTHMQTQVHHQFEKEIRTQYAQRSCGVCLGGGREGERERERARAFFNVCMFCRGQYCHPCFGWLLTGEIFSTA